MKLDMSKAYDRVEWRYLRLVMEKMGFNQRWVDLIMNCVETVNFLILLNGEPRRCFTPNRGLRQGDPLSPYLFLLCVEGLSALLNWEEQRHLLIGLRINKYCPSINHLFYADDNLIFFKVAEQDCQTLKRIFKTYSRASGQIINFDKSQFMVSKNTSVEIRDYIIRELNVPFTKQIGEYLGLPSQCSRNKSQVFNSI